jgi:predicted PurR-regulated permease PerM
MMSDRRDCEAAGGSRPSVRSLTRIVLQVLLAVAAIAAGLWMLYRVERVLLVLVLATFFAYVIAPLVRVAERPVRIGGRSRRLSRGPAILVVYALMTGGAGAAAEVLVPSVAQQIDEVVVKAPAYTASFRVWQRGWSRYYERLRIPVEVRQGIDGAVLGMGDTAIGYARGSLMTVVRVAAYVPWLVLIPVLAFFLLRDADDFRRTLIKALPRSGQPAARRLFGELNATLAAYVRAQLLACVIVGTVCGAGFALLRVPYAVLLGILAAVFEFVPLVGPLVVAIVATVVAAFHNPWLALWTAGFLAVLRVVEDYAVYPRLVGRNIHLHPLVVVIAVLAGVELGGVAGIFIAIPTVAVLSVAARHWLDWRAERALPGMAS